MCGVSNICCSQLLSPPEYQDEELEDQYTKSDKSRTTNIAMAKLAYMVASLQVFNAEINWDEITDDLTWSNDDANPSYE